MEKVQTISLDHVLDRELGARGTEKREKFEFELSLESIGYQIKALRAAQEISQTELGNQLGVTKTQISRIENGNQNVTVETLIKVFNALGGHIKLCYEPL